MSSVYFAEARSIWEYYRQFPVRECRTCLYYTSDIQILQINMTRYLTLNSSRYIRSMRVYDCIRTETPISINEPSDFLAKLLTQGSVITTLDLKYLFFSRECIINLPNKETNEKVDSCITVSYSSELLIQINSAALEKSRLVYNVLSNSWNCR